MPQNSSSFFITNQTKIIAPEIKSPLLLRKSIFLSMTQTETPSLIKIIAPAGFGKSILMFQLFNYYKNLEKPCAWLNIDPGDNDISRFIRYLAATLSFHHPDEFKNSNKILNAGTITNIRNIKSRFIKDLEQLDQPVYLFIDDFHQIHEKEVLQLWQWLLQNSSNKIKIILASRNNLSFHHHKNCLVITRKDLAFSQNEISTYFLQVQNLKLSKQELQDLYSKTEGWVLALQLYGLFFKNLSGHQYSLKTISGYDQDLFVYLTETILNQQTTELRNFLSVTSLFDRFSSELCNEILHISNSQDLINLVQAKNLFLIPLDRNYKWFRYHHLFQEFLQNSLKRQNPNFVQILYEKASSWFEKSGLKTEAIEYAIKIKNFDRAANLISGYAVELTSFQGDHSTLLSWMKEIPKEYLFKYPMIWVGYISSLILVSQFYRARHELDKINFLLFNPNKKTTQLNQSELNYFRGYYEMLEILYAAYLGDYEYIKREGNKWLHQYQQADSFQKTSVLFANGVCWFYEFEFQKVYEGLQSSLEIMRSSKNYYAIAWYAFWIGLVWLEQGRLQKSREQLEYYLNILEQNFPADSFPIFMNRLHLIEQYYEQAEFKKCQELIENEFVQLDNYGGFISLIAIYRNTTRFYMITERYQKAQKTLDHGLKVADMRNNALMKLVLTYQKILLFIKTDHTELAHHFHKNMISLETNRQKYLEENLAEFSKLIRIRIWLNGGKGQKALESLRRLDKNARKKNRIRHLILLLLLEARASFQIKNTPQAKKFIKEALYLSVPEGFISIFLEEGREISNAIIETLNKIRGNEIKDHEIDDWKRQYETMLEKCL